MYWFMYISTECKKSPRKSTYLDQIIALESCDTESGNSDTRANKNMKL